ncbi:hypothetical protein GALMADRAFT_1364881 [Galerina marginata CBS 339.88]|uniref:Major facilitator superfamily (MFS) profile domain-containing protein n=1 Tax=Galerina marginata (strain CBS 339.88) TaxID=685588 RepID=A0A067T619_GALM3|nr:hypothetical protein GALMADRAFT_1364881 [Galerina marginata CBS 339.88]
MSNLENHTDQLDSQVEIALSGLPSPSSKDSTGRTPRVSDKRDEALDILPSSGKPALFVTAAEDAHLVRKIDRRLMPIVFVIYFLQLLARQSVSFSAVFGLSQDAGLKDKEYSLVVSIFSIAQLSMQPLSAYLLVRLRLSTYVPLIVTCWGATLACTAAAQGFPGLLCGRFFLGVFEASIQSSFVLTTQMWYRRHEQGFRLAIWYSNIGWVNVFGSLIMFGLGHIRSSALYSYQIIFLILGLVTVFFGLLSFFIFPDNASRCTFLKTEEKVMAVERIRDNQQGMESKTFKIKQFLEVLGDVKTWCWVGIGFLVALPGGIIGSFGPLIMRGFGFDAYTVMLFLIPYGVSEVLFIFGGFWLNKRFSLKSPIIFCCLLPCVCASIILLKTGRSPEDQPILLFAYYLLSSLAVVLPTLVNWQSSNVSGHTKKSVTISFLLMGSTVGGIIGPLLISSKNAPYYRKGKVTLNLSSLSSCAILVLFTVAYLWHLNRLNRKRRIANGKAGKIVDYSMLSAANAEKRRLEYLGGSLTGSEAVGSRAFDDLTDLENDEFIVSIFNLSEFYYLTWEQYVY